MIAIAAPPCETATCDTSGSPGQSSGLRPLTFIVSLGIFLAGCPQVHAPQPDANPPEEEENENEAH